MRARRASVIEERVHRDLPEARKLGLSFAHPVDDEAVVGHAVVERVRPEGVLKNKKEVICQ